MSMNYACAEGKGFENFETTKGKVWGRKIRGNDKGSSD
jgi:hypothetical protein